ncbi:MAG: hypothetical protein JXA72_14025 [Bacteroidales bacterium]|nr:hypothetical protein [Bacteroidales bacterium]
MADLICHTNIAKKPVTSGKTGIVYEQLEINYLAEELKSLGFARDQFDSIILFHKIIVSLI